MRLSDSHSFRARSRRRAPGRRRSSPEWPWPWWPRTPRAAAAPSPRRSRGTSATRRGGRAPRSATRSSCRRIRRSASRAQPYQLLRHFTEMVVRAPDDTRGVGWLCPVSATELEPQMQTITTIRELRAALAPLRTGTIGLVPTMGALHAGHVALFDAARADSDTVVASLFVNPAQFEAGTAAAYPRDVAADGGVASDAGVDFLFAPPVDELYPPGFATWVDPAGAAEGLEGEHRPGHFRGVATVCVKLFAIVRPVAAYFGRKDAQQVAVVKQVVRDLNLELEIRVVPTVRDADGLALSSRNALLSAEERALARALPRALDTRDPALAREVLVAAGVEPDYVAVADLDGPTLAVAARIGSTRLIDNVLLEKVPA